VLYVDSLTTARGPAPTYLRLMEYNAQTIVRGLTQP
jgi:manganese/iron transport system substrate-binding protein